MIKHLCCICEVMSLCSLENIYKPEMFLKLKWGNLAVAGLWAGISVSKYDCACVNIPES